MCQYCGHDCEQKHKVQEALDYFRAFVHRETQDVARLEESLSVLNGHVRRLLFHPVKEEMRVEVVQTQRHGQPLSIRSLLFAWKNENTEPLRKSLDIQDMKPQYLHRPEGGLFFHASPSFFSDFYGAPPSELWSSEPLVAKHPIAFCFVTLVHQAYEGKESEPLPTYFALKAGKTFPRAAMIFLLYLLEERFHCRVYPVSGLPDAQDPVHYYWNFVRNRQYALSLIH